MVIKTIISWAGVRIRWKLIMSVFTLAQLLLNLEPKTDVKVDKLTKFDRVKNRHLSVSSNHGCNLG